ncbi:MAG TPA: methionyl-tRNA formyltransferase [Lachnospiraceae bacterium]|nr:methionyl-tRNA formyltransferase [Lachnospiraceae bacterium]
MKVVFMGTPEFAVKSLEMLIEKHQVVAVVTQPDRPKGRGKKMVFPAVKEKALEHNIPVLQPESAKNADFISELKKYEADIFVVAAYGQILTEEVLNMPMYGSVNVHGSLLPKYRGAGPIQWSVINGEKITGVTIMYMAKGLDSGDMISSVEMEISDDDTYGTLSDRMAEVGAELLGRTLVEIENGTAKRIPQNHDESTYAPMLTKETGHIDWNKTSREISCLIRGLDPQPGAYTIYNDEVLKVWKVVILENTYPNALCGEIVETNKKGFIVKTADKAILVAVIQAKGGKAMPSDAYMRGHAIETGVVLR